MKPTLPTEGQPPQDKTVPNSSRSAWRITAWVTAIFSLLVGLTLLGAYLRVQADAPLKSLQLKDYKAQLRANPDNEPLKERVRQLDLQQRQYYFRHLAQKNSGVYLLLGGLAVFILAMSRLHRFRQQLPNPQPRADMSDEALRGAARARWSVVSAGALIAAFFILVSLGFTPTRTQVTGVLAKMAGGDNAAASSGDFAPAEELKQNWPRFRGPGGNGVSVLSNMPVAWDVKTGSGIAWKRPTPAQGYNSPIAWRDRVFFSGVGPAVPGGPSIVQQVICLDANTGQTAWQQEIPEISDRSPGLAEDPPSSGYAASTMATDGRRVYTLFGSGDLAVFSLDGKPVWSKALGPLKNSYGHASSLATWRDHLLVQLDQGESEQGKSRLYALDGRNGQILWQQPRKVGSSWATPLVIEAAGKIQVITLAVPWVIAYDAASGAELWRVECLSGEVTPSPAFAGGLVFVASPSEKLLAIRPDGTGDVTKTHVVWTTEENVPDITSPATDGELLFTLTSSGMLACFDAQNGKKQWEHDFQTEFHSSPSLVAGRVYLFGTQGTAVVVEAARQFKEVFRGGFADSFVASPAFAANRIFLRGQTNLYSLAAGEQLARQ